MFIEEATSFINRHRIAIGLAVLILTIFVLNTATHPAGYNDQSRLAGIVSIVRLNQLNIDGTPYEDTGDRAEFEGKKFSSKPPFLHVSLGYIIKALFNLKPELQNNDVAIYRMATYLANSLSLAGIFFFSYLIFLKFKLSKVRSIIYGLVLVFGTLIFSFSKFLNNHILEAFLSTVLLQQVITFDDRKHRISTAVMLGITLSLLFAADIVFGFVAFVVTTFWIVSKIGFNLKYLGTLYLSALPIVFAHFYLSIVQFGSIIPPQLLKDTYFSYEGSLWIGEGRGLSTLQHPFSIRLLNFTFGTHGLFLYQPVLLMALLMRVDGYKFHGRRYVLAISLIFILITAYFQEDYAGTAYGPRRFIPLIPMLYVYSILSIEKWKDSSPKYIIGIVLLGITVVFSILGYLNPWANGNLNELIDVDMYFPLIYTFYKFVVV
jgi:hypothetical protein